MPDGGQTAFPIAVAVTASVSDDSVAEFVIVAGSPLGGSILNIAEVKSKVL
jgi:hypothetical protein